MIKNQSSYRVDLLADETDLFLSSYLIDSSTYVSSSISISYWLLDLRLVLNKLKLYCFKVVYEIDAFLWKSYKEISRLFHCSVIKDLVTSRKLSPHLKCLSSIPYRESPVKYFFASGLFLRSSASTLSNYISCKGIRQQKNDIFLKVARFTKLYAFVCQFRHILKVPILQGFSNFHKARSFSSISIASEFLPADAGHRLSVPGPVQIP